MIRIVMIADREIERDSVILRWPKAVVTPILVRLSHSVRKLSHLDCLGRCTAQAPNPSSSNDDQYADFRSLIMCLR